MFRNIDGNEWNNFLIRKSTLNPLPHIKNLLNRRLLLIHGKEDKTIRSYHTERFYNTLISGGSEANSQFLTVDGVGHGKVLRSKTWDYWTNWILN
ncbi:prolyl oligopeptidase family serine peptidase [Paenibacillus azoreducens]|uniref:Peptidase S9 prolyl oligopeptidase catalytic domain-containing protein n=1 Tax=Paenibacillus azoreducens TaxID=116718 RepID=A0A919YAZ2_9BACL|nr:hypothetical protein J34TS1_18490 [Paenibacillus azoreducens]